jgi:hypothetical protein
MSKREARKLNRQYSDYRREYHREVCLFFGYEPKHALRPPPAELDLDAEDEG